MPSRESDRRAFSTPARRTGEHTRLPPLSLALLSLALPPLVVPFVLRVGSTALGFRNDTCHVAEFVVGERKTFGGVRELPVREVAPALRTRSEALPVRVQADGVVEGVPPRFHSDSARFGSFMESVDDGDRGLEGVSL